MLRLARRASPLGLALVAVLLMQGTALAAIKDVSIVDFAFSPAKAKIKLGDSVHWTNTGSFTHTSSSDGFNDGQGTVGVDLWHSGNLAPSAQFTFTFVVAGTFLYHCSIHSFMHGRVAVPMKLNPSSGPVGTSFKIIWATADPGSDFVFNVQMTDANGQVFHDWMTNVPHTQFSAKFKPNQAGTYMFRAQLKRVSTGQASGFSPAKSIVVG